MEAHRSSLLSPKRLSLLKVQQRAQLLRAVIVGLLAGLLAVLFHRALAFFDQGRLELLEILHQYPGSGWLVFPVIGALGGSLAAWITSRYAPEASGSGIPHVKAVLLNLQPFHWARVLLVKFFGGILALGSGFSLGREGPTVQMGSAIGKMVSNLFKVSHKAEHKLIAAGGGAGLAAAFNAPLAGFVFVIEEFHFDMSIATYGTALIAAVIGDTVTRSFHGQLPSFLVFRYPTPPLAAMPFFALLGLTAGVAGLLFSKILLRGVRFTRNTGHSHSILHKAPLRAAIIGAIVGGVIWFLPEATGGGTQTVESILNGQFNSSSMISTACLILGVKFLLTILCYLAGTPGGIFAPMLVLGALVGYLTGQFCTFLWPSLGVPPASFAVTGMAAIFSSIVQAPLTGVILILEMTGNYHQMFPMIIACSVSYLTAEWLHGRPIYEGLLAISLRGSHHAVLHASEPRLLDLAAMPNSLFIGKSLRELNLPKGCLLITVTREEAEMVPDGETVIKPNDRLEFIISGDAAATAMYLHELARGESRHVFSRARTDTNGHVFNPE